MFSALKSSLTTGGCDHNIALEYYNRPAFLVSPDPLNDVLPSWLVKRRSMEDVEAQRNFAVPPADVNSAKQGRVLNIDVEMVDQAAFESCQTGLTPFPPPPTFEEFREMHPDLPLATLKRMACLSGGESPTLSMVEDDTFSPFTMSTASSDSDGHFGCRSVVQESSPVSFDSNFATRGTRPNFDWSPAETHAVGFGVDHSEARRAAEKNWRTKPFPDTRCEQEPRALANAKPKLSLPEASDEDRRTLGALAGWVTDYLYELATAGKLCDEPSIERLHVWHFTASYRSAVDQIRHILLGTLLPRSTVFLALWYTARLPSSPFSVVYPQDIGRFTLREMMIAASDSMEGLIVQMFLVGAMLADKWANDHTFATKAWHVTSGVPVSTLNGLEKSALRILDYELHITSNEWQQWLGHLRHWHSCLTPLQPVGVFRTSPYSSVSRAIDEVIEASHPGCDARGAASPQFLKSLQRGENHDVSLFPAWDAPHMHAEQTISSSLIRLPPEWSTEADPIVSRPIRTVGVAPGMYRGTSSTSYSTGPSYPRQQPLHIPALRVAARSWAPQRPRWQSASALCGESHLSWLSTGSESASHHRWSSVAVGF